MGRRRSARKSEQARSEQARSEHARSEHDLAALLIRLAVGPMLIAHGYNKVWGGGGLEGTERWFASLGFQPAKVHARMAAATEIGTGTLITVGALNPLPSAALIGLMTVAARTDHRGKGFFVFKGGWEYTAVLGVLGAALAAMGYGRWSVDRLVGRHRRGLGAALVAVALGLGNASALMAASYRPEPPAEPDAA